LENLSAQGLSLSQVEFVRGKRGRAQITTTLGPVDVDDFAYRARKDSGPVQSPARDTLFPLLPKCRSTELLLEWETRLGAEHPFRLAQDELSFFTHGATTVADNTIARHVVRAAAALEQRMLYKEPAEIAEILKTRATADAETGKPVLYASSDAHALRRYVSETWSTPWKMANGIRLWCIDKNTGETIHLGGQFTWGDCREVKRIFERLFAEGILRAEGTYSDGVSAKYVWLSDGMPWFEEHVLPLFNADAIEVVLDVYHLLDRVSTCAKALFPDDDKARADWYGRIAFDLTGKRPSPKRKARARKGHRKTRRGSCPAAPSVPLADVHNALIQTGPDETTTTLLDHLLAVEARANTDTKKAAVEKLLNYVAENAYRANYVRYRLQGLQIGSGAMESVHRSGSQQRLKRPGARWLAETSQALLNWRMLRLCGRWEDFWRQPDIARLIAGGWSTAVINYPLPMDPADAA
jgi:hypothetical protein